MRTFEIVHNIPSPYRLHLFRNLAAGFQERDVRLHVNFLSSSHRDRRTWTEQGQECGFSYTYWKDLGIYRRGKEWHFNPGLVANLLRKPPDYLMVGGPWDSVTAAVISLSARRCRAIAWFEGNTKTPGRTDSLSLVLKRQLLSPYHIFAVPGEEGRKYAELLCGEKLRRRIVVLPNVVDEEKFRAPDLKDIEAVKRELKIGPSMRLAVWPARLTPAKGILELLEHMRPEHVRGWQIVVLGDGELREAIERKIATKGLAENVRIHPMWPYSRMPALYHSSNLFMLPSLHDPNPLSVVEALHSGLPILVSDQIGNLPEALRDKVNGWKLSPFDKHSVHEAIQAAFSSDPAELRKKGEESRHIAEATWCTRRAVESFIRSVLER